MREFCIFDCQEPGLASKIVYQVSRVLWGVFFEVTRPGYSSIGSGSDSVG
jgi:hypothetical protein